MKRGGIPAWSLNSALSRGAAALLWGRLSYSWAQAPCGESKFKLFVFTGSLFWLIPTGWDHWNVDRPKTCRIMFLSIIPELIGGCAESRLICMAMPNNYYSNCCPNYIYFSTKPKQPSHSPWNAQGLRHCVIYSLLICGICSAWLCLFITPFSTIVVPVLVTGWC